MMKLSASVLAGVGLLLATAACGDDSGSSTSGGGSGGSGGSDLVSSTGAGAGSPEQTGAQCDSADQCYPGVAAGDLSGEAICLDQARGGYCTHECATDADCCGAEGECETGVAQVCSPFESTGQDMCFLSCEDEDVGDSDEQAYCQLGAGRDFICRSSGGGSDNRKICFPGDCGVGAACEADGDCTGDLTCITSLFGGYCSREGCETSDECPEGSRCVAPGGGEPSACLRTCSAESDCSFCRGEELAASCTDEAEFVDGSPETVCVPSSL